VPQSVMLPPMKRYGQFCPIAKAGEILTERWTLLVLRDLLYGSRRFNDLRRGVPLMSPTLLSTRLRTLEEAGLIVRKASDRRGHWEYHLTQAGEELRPIVDAIGHWGQTWARSKLTPDEIDPGRLMWTMHRHFILTNVPQDRLVLYIEITDAKRLPTWWFILTHDSADLCWDDPGGDVDVSLYADLLTLTQIYIGDLSLPRARKLGKIEVLGSKNIVGGISTWFPRSKFADDKLRPMA
jgi:DNA-binding HxlR family transcriptional regulator